MKNKNQSCDAHKFYTLIGRVACALLLSVTLPAFAEYDGLVDAEQFGPDSPIDGEGWADLYDPNNNSLRLLPYVEIEGMAIHDGDMVLGPVSNFQASSAPEDSLIQNGVATRSLGNRWDDGIVHYNLNGHPGSATILSAMAGIEEKTSIRFAERTDQRAYIRFINGSGCWSYIGRTNSAQDISLQNSGCVYKGIAQHEIFHALGVFHEQSRNDRDNHVIINYENIKSGLSGNFNIAGNSFDIGPYDFSSIMHYSRRAFSKNGLDTITTIPPGISIGNRRELSDGDILTIQTMYYTDLQLDISTVNQVAPGGTFSLQITVDNPGNDADIGSIIAKDVEVSIPVPGQSTYNQFSSSDNWDCQQSGQTIECNLEILDRNSDTSLTLDFTAPSTSASLVFDAVVNGSNHDPDTSDNSASATVVVSSTGGNSLPVVSITSPASGSSFVAGASITLRGAATDAEDGTISSNIVWTSSRDGSLGTGASRTRSNLSVGTHTITARITDSNSASDSATITLRITSAPVVVPNTKPVISIGTPVDGKTYRQTDNVTFSASASDAEEGNLSGKIAWSSDRDGNLGTGGIINKTGLSIGKHRITASITDRSNATAIAEMNLEIEAEPVIITPPPTTPPTTTTGGGSGSGGSGSFDWLALFFVSLLAGFAWRRQERDLT